MVWLLAGETWLNMDQAVHVTREGGAMVVAFAVGLSQGTFPYMQRYEGETASAILAWLEAEVTVEDELDDAEAMMAPGMNVDTVVVVETTEVTPDDEALLGNLPAPPVADSQSILRDTDD